MRNKEKRKYIFIFAFVVGIVIFIGYTLTQFHRDIQDRVYKKQIETMKNISMQGSAVVEKKLGGMVNILYGLAEYVQEDDIDSDANIENLQEFLEKRDIGFSRLGIAHDNGMAKITNGEQIDISNREYFRTCMEEQKATTEIRQSDIVEEPVCIVAVPILREKKGAIGVLYGVTELTEFRIYDDTILENKNQYIQIIDMDGNYIRKQKSSLIGKKNNIFDGIGSIEGKETADAIREQIQKEEQVYTEISNGKSHEIVYFTPLKLNNWCIVTVIDYGEVTELVDYILEDDTYMMTLKIILAITLFAFLIMYYSWKERKQIKEFNEKLLIDEKIVSIAAKKSRFAIMSYGIKTKQLRFINNAIWDMKFPKQIDNAPEEIMKYIPEDEGLKDQVRNIFNSIINKSGESKIPLALMREGRKVYMNMQLIPIADSKGEVCQYIGVLEDRTEEQRLRDRADRDALTGLYNRSSAQEKISHCLKESKLHPGAVHAYMIMDLDNFKTLNDTLGHQMGDKALQDVSEILTRHFRSYDVVCRLGGDEFLVFMKDIPENVVERNVESLLRKLVLHYEEDGRSVQITASAGIVLIYGENVDFRKIYRRADEALYQVKHETKNGFKISRY